MGGSISRTNFENFSVGPPGGLSNRRAMIPAAKWNALLRWTVSGNQFLQLLQLPAALSSWLLRTVKMPTAHDSGASSFRHECIVRGCAVCIICARASLPSLKMPPIRTQFLIHLSKSLPARLMHRRSCVRRIIGNAAHKSPSVSSSANCRAPGAHTSNKEPTVVMIVGFFMP